MTEKAQKAVLESDIGRLVNTHLGVDIERIETSEWYGSCQYLAIEDTHKLLNKIGPDMLEVSYSYFNTKPTKALLANWYQDLVKANDTELLKEDKYLDSSLDDIAIWACNQAWDLWVVAYWLSRYQSKGTLKTPRFMKDMDSVQAGVACWFLVEKCRMTTKALDGMCT